jgi:hypothetical protein
MLILNLQERRRKVTGSAAGDKIGLDRQHALVLAVGWITALLATLI